MEHQQVNARRRSGPSATPAPGPSSPARRRRLPLGSSGAPAKYRGWNGAVANHSYNWHDSIHAGGGCGAILHRPPDDTDHSTHHGDDGRRRQRRQPGRHGAGARWINCRNMGTGASTPTTYIECFRWFIRRPASPADPDQAWRRTGDQQLRGCRPQGCNPATSRDAGGGRETCALLASSSPSRPGNDSSGVLDGEHSGGDLRRRVSRSARR